MHQSNRMVLNSFYFEVNNLMRDAQLLIVREVAYFVVKNVYLLRERLNTVQIKNTLRQSAYITSGLHSILLKIRNKNFKPN